MAPNLLDSSKMSTQASDSSKKRLAAQELEILRQNWERVAIGLMNLGLSKAYFAPQNFAEFAWHTWSSIDHAVIEKIPRLARQTAQVALEWRQRMRHQSYARQAIVTDFGTNHSTVLSKLTIWSPWYHEMPNHSVSMWPCLEEYEWEGDMRAVKSFGRFLPIPRVMGNETVAWKQRALNHTYDLDAVAHVPFDFRRKQNVPDEVEDRCEDFEAMAARAEIWSQDLLSTESDDRAIRAFEGRMSWEALTIGAESAKVQKIEHQVTAKPADQVKAAEQGKAEPTDHIKATSSLTKPSAIQTKAPLHDDKVPANPTKTPADLTKVPTKLTPAAADLIKGLPVPAKTPARVKSKPIHLAKARAAIFQAKVCSFSAKTHEIPWEAVIGIADSGIDIKRQFFESQFQFSQESPFSDDQSFRHLIEAANIKQLWS